MKSKYDFYVLTMEGHFKGSKERFPILTFFYPLTYAEARAACKLLKTDGYERLFDLGKLLGDPEQKYDQEIVVTMKPRGIKLSDTKAVDIDGLCIQR